jgi:multidrug efflux pump subunit AcrA (membrane-fusion protein)
MLKSGFGCPLIVVMYLSSFVVPATAKDVDTTAMVLASNYSWRDKSSNLRGEDLPIKAKACAIEEIVVAAAQISSQKYSESRSKYPTTIKSIHVAVGDKVKRGALLASADTDSLKKMLEIYLDYERLIRSELKVIAGKTESTKARRARLKSLVEKKIVSESDLDQIDKWIQTLENERERMLNQLESFRKSIRQYTSQIHNANFYSEIDGEVTRLIADPKSIIGVLNAMSESLIARVEQAGAYTADMPLLDSQVQKIKVGMNAKVILPDGSSYNGHVTQISTLPFQEKRDDASSSRGFGANAGSTTELPVTYLAKVDFKRPGPILPAGLHASVEIIAGTHQAKLCLPWNAIQVSDRGNFINAFTEGAGFRVEPVILGKTGRYYVEILSPLSENVITLSRLW